MRAVPIRLALPALIIALLTGLAGAQTIDDRPEVVAAFLRADQLMHKELWGDAAAAFDTLAQQYPSSANLPLFVFCRAKAQYYNAHYRDAVKGFDNVVIRFPQSPQRPFAAYFAGNCRYQLRDLAAAIRQYIDAYAHSESQELDRLIINSLAAFEAVSVEGVIGSSSTLDLPAEQKCRMAYDIAQSLERTGQQQKAAAYRAWCDTSSSAANVSGNNVAAARILRVAVVLPLSGEMQAFGEDVFNGAVIGADLARNDYSFTITLTPFDTKANPIVAARIAKDLTNQSFDAMIGPLTSDEAAVASASLGCGDFPMIIPAATESGITELSPGSYQLSPNIQLQGAHMAEYAARTLMADSAAVIAPVSDEQSEMVQAFVERFKELGGTIVATEFYRDRDKDFGVYIRDVKKMVLGHTPDSAVFLDDRGDTLEAEAIPAHIDCLFLPGSSDQLRHLLTQLRFYNLSASLLGSDGWGDEAIYNLGEDVTRGAVFPSPFIQSSSGALNPAFSTAYIAKYGRKPSRLACLGFDAMQLLARSALRGSLRERLLTVLSKTSGYEGAAGKVTFGPHRENVELPLYRISAGRAVSLDIAGGNPPPGKGK